MNFRQTQKQLSVLKQKYKLNYKTNQSFDKLKVLLKETKRKESLGTILTPEQIKKSIKEFRVKNNEKISLRQSMKKLQSVYQKLKFRESTIDLINEVDTIERSINRQIKVVSARELDSHFSNTIKAYEITQDTITGYDGINIIKKFQPVLVRDLKQHRNIKFQFLFNVEFKKMVSEGEYDYESFKHYLTVSEAHNVFDVRSSIVNKLLEIQSWIEEFTQRGSGWILTKVLGVYCNVMKYRPVRGSQYIKLPDWVNNKKCLVNIKNKDNKCFMYSVLYGIYKIGKDPQRVSKYKSIYKFGLDKLEYPMRINKIGEAESLVKRSIYVYEYTEGENKRMNIFPLRVVKNKYPGTEPIKLLLIQKGKKTHYVYIKNFNGLFNTKGNQYFACPRCLHKRTSQRLLDEHIVECSLTPVAKTLLPPNNGTNYTKFDKYYTKFKTPFSIYLDFESTLKTIEDVQYTNKRDINNKLIPCKTQKYQEHEANSYMIVIKSEFFETQKISYRGPNTMEHFIEDIVKISDDVKSKVQHIVPMDDKVYQHQNNIKHLTKKCHICEKPFNDEESDWRVLDHCHFTGKFRGVAHNSCNVNLTNKFTNVPVFAHNMKGYDSHLIIKAMNAIKSKINCIPANNEKFITFGFDNIKFLDSYAFLSSSLDQLTEDTIGKVKDGNIEDVHRNALMKLPETMRAYPEKRKQQLLLRKGVYPYDYVKSQDVFLETELPPKEAFYNRLTEKGISDDDYSHAQQVWDIFDCKTFGDYHDLYLETDTLLLCDIFENFRVLSIDTYGLDPCHFITLPGYSWNAMLKKTEVELELITDQDQYLFIERGIRGGISVISHRHAKANNSYIKSEIFDSTKPESYIPYLDANNLYGWAMSQYLPFNNIRWCNTMTQEKLMTISDTADTGYILEVDLEVPDELHHKFNDYPLAPEGMKVNYDEMSQYQRDLADKNRVNVGKTSKLIPNLKNKEKYIVHYRNLKFYLNQGMVLKKIHRVLQFSQKPWLKQYIDCNTKLRAQAKTKFEKDFYKLLNNAVYGKTMENVRNHSNLEIVNSEIRMQKLIADFKYKKHTTITKDLLAVERIKRVVHLDKPIYVGMCILDLSKLCMYDFHYNYIIQEFPNAKLLMTDTDSLTYYIETKDFYTQIKDNDLFDFSSYPKHHPNYSVKNKKVPGKFSDETESVPIKEFIGLRSKMYCNVLDTSYSIKAKGIKKSASKKIKPSEFKDTLSTDKTTDATFNSLRSYNHTIKSIQITKKSLSSFDDKRYILPDKVSTLAYGHYLLR